MKFDIEERGGDNIFTNTNRNTDTNAHAYVDT